MEIRPFRGDDAAPLAALSASCLKGETDFVLNPLWETEAELVAEFARFGIEPGEHVLVAQNRSGEPVGMVGFLRRGEERHAGLIAPVVRRDLRGEGLGGELLRAAIEHGRKLGITLVTGTVGTRNRGGYALLTSLGFQAVRQHFIMRCDERPAIVNLPFEGVSIEVAKPGDDADAIYELYSASGFDEARSPERIAEVLSDGIHFHAVARHQGEVVAFAEIETHWPRRVWLSFIGVRGDVRNQGVGTAVAAWALQRQFDAEAEAALLLLSPVNRPAVRAYQKVGFHLHRTVDVLQRGL